MMQWRAPNKAKRYERPDLVECHLGEVIGQLEPMRPLPPRRYGSSEPPWRLQAVMGVIAGLVYLAILAGGYAWFIRSVR